ncbi:hypothetical protein GCM10023331_21680 [Algivirga pacifica]|uniref:OmpA-like domain-containing protein n=2 Tax=Algivirga pacifica TaxID=1162670 RepID=A0ABP9DEE9_9BACT
MGRFKLNVWVGKVWLLSALLLLFHGSLLGQRSIWDVGKSPVLVGEKLMEQGRYEEALTIMEEAFLTDMNNPLLIRQIITCYHVLGNSTENLSWYKKLENNMGMSEQHRLAYGDLLRREGYKQEAAYQYRLGQEKSEHKQLYAYRLLSLEHDEKLHDSLEPYQVKSLSFNTSFDEYAPLLQDSSLSFTSNRPSVTGMKEQWDGHLWHRRFLATGEQQNIVEPLKREEIFTTLQTTEAAFFDHHTKAIYTHRQKDGHTALHLATFSNGKWKDKGRLAFCQEGYDYQNPVWSPDQTYLFFSSNQPKGMGGMDLYYIQQKEGRWERVIAMGKEVNTAGDEVTPYLASDYTFYFSSNGLPGLGGFDVHKGVFDQGHLLEVKPMGHPANSMYDDTHWVWDANKQVGYLSSDRAEEKNRDIYQLSLNPEVSYTVEGTVIWQVSAQGMPEGLADASIQITDQLTGQKVGVAYSDGSGDFSIHVPYSGSFELVFKHGNRVHRKQLTFPMKTLKDQRLLIVFYGIGEGIEGHEDAFVSRYTSVYSTRFWRKWYNAIHRPCEMNSILKGKKQVHFEQLQQMQGTDRQAQAYFHQKDFEKAFQTYWFLINNNPENTQYREQAAQALFYINRPYEALFLLNSLLCEGYALKETTYKLLAEVMIQTGRYSYAKKYYRKYLNAKADPKVSRILEGLDQLGMYLKDSTIYHVTPVSVNTDANEYGAVFTEEGVSFLSDRKGKKQRAFTHLFHSKKSEDYKDFQQTYKVKGDLNSRIFEGPHTYFPGGDRMLITRNKKKGRKKRNLGIEELQKKGDRWVSKGKFILDQKGYQVGHPSLNQTGDTLYFISDMPGGYGGTDIYRSTYNKGLWSTPENMGEEVNTSGNEVFPFIADSLFYFSSDGHKGLGGLDIFRAEVVNGAFTNTTNMGFPVNSHKDDFGLVLDSTSVFGYFSSNRRAKGDDDIYHLQIYKTFSYVISGTVVLHDRNPKNDQALRKEGVQVSLIDVATEDTVSKSVSDIDGRFWLRAPYAGDFNLLAEDEELGAFPMMVEIPMYRNFYEDYSIAFMETDQAYFREDVWLEQKKDISKEYLRQKLYEKENKLPCFSYAGRVLDAETNEAVTDAMVLAYDINTGIIYKEVTDEEGYYGFCLDANSKYTFKIMKYGYLTGCYLDETAELPALDPAPPVLLERLPINGELLFSENFYYSVNSSDITPEIETGLNEVVKLLKENPTLKVEIASHTDARGSATYNTLLSSVRAKKISLYLIEHGIAIDRVISNGYGESEILNHCEDGVLCSDEEHGFNRRTEVRLIGMVDAVQDQGFYQEIFDYAIDQSGCLPVNVSDKEQLVVYIGQAQGDDLLFLSGVKVRAVDALTGEVFTVTSLPNGYFRMKLRAGAEYMIQSFKEGYWPVAEEVQVPIAKGVYIANPTVMKRTQIALAEMSFLGLTEYTVPEGANSDWITQGEMRSQLQEEIPEVYLPDYRSGYAIQVGSYRRHESVDFESLKGLGKVCRHLSKVDQLHRYFLMRFDTQEEVEKALRKVRAKGIKDAFIYPLKAGLEF